MLLTKNQCLKKQGYALRDTLFRIHSQFKAQKSSKTKSVTYCLNVPSLLSPSLGQYKSVISEPKSLFSSVLRRWANFCSSGRIKKFLSPTGHTLQTRLESYNYTSYIQSSKEKNYFGSRTKSLSGPDLARGPHFATLALNSQLYCFFKK